MRIIQMAFVLSLATASVFAQTPLIEQGRAAINLGDSDTAIATLEKAVAQAPNSAEAHYYLGEAYLSKGAKANLFSAASWARKAKDELNRAVGINPNYNDARFSLVQFYSQAPGIMGGDMDKALDHAAQIKKTDPLMGHRALAFIYTQQKKPELAKKEYTDAVEEQTNSAKAHYFYGGYLGNTEKDYKSAFVEFDRAIRLDPTYMPPSYWIGRAAAESGINVGRGGEMLKKYMAYTPKEGEPPLANAHHWLGIIDEKQGHVAEAKREFQTALRLNPDLKMAADALKRVSQ
jgi:Tfp pilus assembly protein PilF